MVGRITEMPIGYQTFATPDIFIVGTLVLLEGLLSADNALVLALLVRHLSDKEQQKALSLGLVMAFVLRGIGILLAGFLIKLWWLCGLGAAYLIFLAVKHFMSKSHDEDDEAALAAGKKQLSFGRTVALVGFTDVVFAVDSILVAVYWSTSPPSSGLSISVGYSEWCSYGSGRRRFCGFCASTLPSIAPPMAWSPGPVSSSGFQRGTSTGR